MTRLDEYERWLTVTESGRDDRTLVLPHRQARHAQSPPRWHPTSRRFRRINDAHVLRVEPKARIAAAADILTMETLPLDGRAAQRPHVSPSGRGPMVIESLCSPLDSEAPEGAGVGSHIVQQVLASLDDVELVLTRSRAGIQVQLAPGERLALRRQR